VGVIETARGADVLRRHDELLAEMARLREKGYASVLFAVVDILAERTTILAVGYEEQVAATLGTEITAEGTLVLPGIISRKKHLVPLLGALSRRIVGG
jgi:manganese-dependent inorganic pyrophosphatase